MEAAPKNRRRLSLTTRILIGMVLGAILGLVLNAVATYPETASDAALPAVHRWMTDGVFYVAGQVFVRFLQLLVVPVVLVSLIAGTASLDDLRRLGRVGLKTLLLYLMTTALAITLAITAAVLIKPGSGVEMPESLAYSPPAAEPLSAILIDMVPRNPFEAIASGNMLQIIVFAICFGITLSLIGDAGKRLLAIVGDLNVAVMKLVDLVMALAPYGVFALIARAFAIQGLGGISALAGYFFVVLGVLAVHLFITYPAMLAVFGRLSPLPFLRKMRAVQLFAFSSASSNATIPLNLENAEKELGAHNSIASFSIPFGATINMDGTAIMQGVATVFISQVYGIEMGIVQYLTVILMATLASVGTAGVPSVGLVTLAMVLREVGLPVEGIAMIIGIDRLLDMARTAVNVSGDAAVTCIVARSEGELDLDTYKAPGSANT